MEENNLTQRLRGRAAYLRDNGEVKSPDLMEDAADEIEDLRNVLRKLVEHDVTYWDNKGEVRHDVGASQSEAMAIFREARQLLTPNAGNQR